MKKHSRLFPTVSDRFQGIAYVCMLLLGLAVLGEYLMAAKPGITPEGWRAILVPYHPSVALAAGGAEPAQVQSPYDNDLAQARRRGRELRATPNGEAQSDSFLKHIGWR